MRRLVIVLVMVLASVFATAPAMATTFRERHCKDTDNGLLHNNVVRVCVEVHHQVQSDGDGLVMFTEIVSFPDGCPKLKVGGVKANPAEFRVPVTALHTIFQNIGPLYKCTNTRLQIIKGPDSGPMDVQLSVKLNTNSGVNEATAHFAFRLQRADDL